MIVSVSIVLAAVGCGGGPKRYEVSGKVTFKGQPVPAGEIYFEPDGTAGNKGPAGFAKIVDGAYSTSSGGKGVVGGPHVVRMNGFSTKPNPASEEPVPALFADYSTKIELKKATNSGVDFAVPDTAAGLQAKPASP